MINKKVIGIGTVLVSLVVYKVLTFKVGPCSPERELNMHKDK